MDLNDAKTIMNAVIQDLQRAAGGIVAVENAVRAARDGAGLCISEGIAPKDMREIVGMSGSVLEDCDRMRAKMAVISRIAAKNA